MAHARLYLDSRQSCEWGLMDSEGLSQTYIAEARSVLLDFEEHDHAIFFLRDGRLEYLGDMIAPIDGTMISDPILPLCPPKRRQL